MNYINGVCDISNADYHASEAISRSDVMRFLKSPHHFKYPPEYKETPSMLLGSLVHAFVLEPEILQDEFAVEPEINRRTKAGKHEYEQFLAEAGTKAIVSRKLYDEAYLINHSVRCNSYALKLLDGATIEQSIFWQEENGLQFKSRPDARQNNIVVDLKTTADASPKAFAQSAYKYGYFMQAAMACRALASIGRVMENFIIIAVETSKPYATATYILDTESIDYAEKEFLRVSDELKQCIDNNAWPAYEPQYISIPNYIMGASDE